MYQTDRRYTKEHEWVLLEGKGQALVGITAFAQEQLGDIVFVDVSKPGTKVEQLQKVGEIESVKAVSDVYSPVAGEVAEVNQAVADKPELLNQDPHGGGWIVRLKSVNVAQLNSLFTAEAYEKYLGEQK